MGSLGELSQRIKNCRLLPDGTITEVNLSLRDQLAHNQKEVKEKLTRNMVADSIANAKKQVEMRKNFEPTQIVQNEEIYKLPGINLVDVMIAKLQKKYQFKSQNPNGAKRGRKRHGLYRK